MRSNQRHQSTLAIAETAFARIGAHRQCADPKSYALWYNVAAGDSGLLSAAVSTRLARGGTLTTHDVEELHAAHVAPNVSDKTARLSARIAGEAAQIAAVIETVEASTAGYSRQLARGSQRLAGAADRKSAQAAAQDLIAAANEMAESNARLQAELHAMWEEMAQLRRDLGSLRAECHTDPLTGLGNNRFFAEALDKTIAECTTFGEPLTLLLVDIDKISAINESYGRIVGDRVLRFVAATLKEGITGRDSAARTRDDRFAVILPRTPLAPAVRTAEQFRHIIMKCELVKRSTGEKQSRLTVSIGVAALRGGMNAQALIETAELCLHGAKRQGRNCVIADVDEKLFAAVAGSDITALAMPVVRG